MASSARHAVIFVIFVILGLALLSAAGCGRRRLSRSGDAGGPPDATTGADGGGAADGNLGADGNLAADGSVEMTQDAGIACTPPSEAPPAPLRRLTGFEYVNSVRDVLGLTALANSLPPDDDPSAPDTNRAEAVAYHDVAHELAVTATKDATALQAIAGCDVAASGEATCAQSFIGAFVARAFRRPVDADDAADFGDVFAKGRALGGDYASGIRAVIEVVLQSPEFLYRVEFGEPADSARPKLGRPTSYEMAVRLSYLVWGSAPDDVLTGAAARNELDTKERIATQARRLMGDARARALTGHFYSQLLQIDDLASRTGLGDLAGPAAEESRRFLDYVIWNGGAGDWNTLLTAPFGFVNGPLAQLYGISGISGDAFQMTTLPAGQRRGFLTQASVLGALSASAGSAHQRAAILFQQLLCGDLSAATPPPPDAAIPPMNPGETHRQWRQRVDAPAACQTCHAQIDPLDVAFEHYGPDGRWRNDDGGLAIDARGMVTGIDTAGSVDGALELIDRLARSRDVDRCHVRKWMESAYGRALVAADACSRQQAEQGFATTGGNIQALILGLTQTDSFLYRPAP